MFTHFKVDLFRAIRRARNSIFAAAITYLLSLSVGAFMVHSGNEFALTYRDRLVATAQTGTVLTQPDPFLMALADFSGNLRGAVADSLGGLGVIIPFPLIAYRGWVGGIVSVDGDHASRLLHAQDAAYYLSVLLLQLTAYTLAAGAGINAGLSLWRPRPEYAGNKWLSIPVEAFRDLGWIYILVVPIFLVASLWEFLSPWR